MGATPSLAGWRGSQYHWLPNLFKGCCTYFVNPRGLTLWSIGRGGSCVQLGERRHGAPVTYNVRPRSCRTRTSEVAFADADPYLRLARSAWQHPSLCQHAGAGANAARLSRGGDSSPRSSAATYQPLFDLLQRQQLRPLVAARMSLSEARAAHELLSKGGVIGKIALIPRAPPTSYDAA
jgi:hypothetical protein